MELSAGKSTLPEFRPPQGCLKEAGFGDLLGTWHKTLVLFLSAHNMATRTGPSGHVPLTTNNK